MLTNNNRPMARWLRYLIMLGHLLLCGNARAQVDARTLAHQHFDKGVAAFNEKRFGDAANEFEEAYRLSPTFAVLYNIGQVNVALGRSLEAVTAFERYLHDGGGAVPAKRASEVRTEIEKQQARIGAIAVRTIPEGADIRLDGRQIGKTPLAEIRVNAGKHAVEAQIAGYLSQAREVDVGGRARVEVALRLDPVIASPLPPAVGPLPPVTSPAPFPAPPPSESPSVLAQPQVAPPAPEHEGPSSTRRTAGFVLAGAGLLTAVIGGVLALEGASAANQAWDRADSASKANQPAAWDQAKMDYDSAKDRNHIGWTIAGAGAVACGAGIVLVLSSPSRRAGSEVRAIAPSVTRESISLAFAGHW